MGGAGGAGGVGPSLRFNRKLLAAVLLVTERASRMANAEASRLLEKGATLAEARAAVAQVALDRETLEGLARGAVETIDAALAVDSATSGEAQSKPPGASRAAAAAPSLLRRLSLPRRAKFESARYSTREYVAGCLWTVQTCV